MLRWLCRLTTSSKGASTCPRENTVLLMKHSSAWETIAQLQIFPMQTWVLKRELMWVPVFGWVLRCSSRSRSIAERRRRGRSAGARAGSGATRGGFLGGDLSGRHASAGGRDAPLRVERRVARERGGPARSCRSRTTRATSGRDAACSNARALCASSSVRQSTRRGVEPRAINERRAALDRGEGRGAHRPSAGGVAHRRASALASAVAGGSAQSTAPERQTSRFATASALRSMNSRRGST